MKVKDRSVIFKADQLNIVDVATGGLVVDNFIQMASDIIFQEDGELPDTVICLTEVEVPKPRIESHLIKGNIGPRLMP